MSLEKSLSSFFTFSSILLLVMLSSLATNANASTVDTSGNLVTSGNEVNDATRSASVEGDGRASPDSSYGIWNVTTNLITNGGFQTNTSGWVTAGTNTIARSTAQSKFGSASLLVTYGNTPSVLTRYAATLTANPHYFSFWIYIPSNYDGTSIFAQFASFTSGTGTTTVFANMSLRDQWQQVIVGPFTPNSGDLAGFLSIINSGSSPTAGRFFYIDGAQLEVNSLGTAYVETNGVTVARNAPRIQMPTSNLSTTIGNISLAFRSHWSTIATAISSRPTLPITLWRWADDSNNGIFITHDGGYATITRKTGGVSDIARVPLAMTVDGKYVVSADWDSDGVRIGSTGSLKRDRITVMADDFERADSSTLGTAPTGGQSWTGTGASVPQIQSGRLVPGSSTGNGYALLDLGATPARMGGITSYDAGSGGSDNVNTTLISSNQDFAIANAVHLLLNRNGWTLQVVESSVFTSIASGSYVTPLATDGTSYPVALGIDGNTATIEAADGKVYSVTDSRIGALAGQYLIWEVARSAPSSTSLASRWDSVYAQSYAASSAGGHSPTLSTSQADVGTDGASSDIVNLDIFWLVAGSGSLTDSDASAINALSNTDPTFNILSSNSRPSFLWDALTPSFTSRSYIDDGGSSSNSSSSSEAICTSMSPTSAPQLFQIETMANKAVLHFSPAGTPVNNYFIIYGFTPTDERFGTAFNYINAISAINYTINDLEPNTTYYFKVKGGNGCMSGEWSNVLKVTTAKNGSKTTKTFTAWEQMKDVVLQWINK